MPERLELKVGDTWPSLRISRRAPSGRAWPTVVGASASLWSMATGSTETATQHTGTITLSIASNVLTAEYAPVAADSVAVSESDAEIEIRFANGQIVTLPGNINGLARYFRISVVESLGDGADPETEDLDDGSGLLGQWIGVSP